MVWDFDRVTCPFNAADISQQLQNKSTYRPEPLLMLVKLRRRERQKELMSASLVSTNLHGDELGVSELDDCSGERTRAVVFLLTSGFFLTGFVPFFEVAGTSSELSPEDNTGFFFLRLLRASGMSSELSLSASSTSISTSGDAVDDEQDGVSRGRYSEALSETLVVAGPDMRDDVFAEVFPEACAASSASDT